MRRFLLMYRDLQTLLRDERLLCSEDRFDAVQGALVAAPTGGWVFRIDAAKGFTQKAPDDHALLRGLSDERDQVKPSTLAYTDYLSRFKPLEQTLRSNGQWFFPHPWLTTFVGNSDIETMELNDFHFAV